MSHQRGPVDEGPEHDAAEPTIASAPGAPPPARRRSRRTILLAMGIAVVLIGSLVGATGVLLDRGQSSTAGGVSNSETPHKQDQPLDEGWPERIRPLAQFVEDARGLEFKHPVPVRFLSDADFRRKVTSDRSDLTDQDRKEIRQTAGLLRAVGLIDGKTDLFDAGNDLAGAGVIGLYSDKDKLIRVRGTKLTPATKVTLVHELTHALQDQYFDLTAHQKALKKADDSSAASAFQALVEGDASRIETAYVQSLTDDERAAVSEEKAKEFEDYQQGASDVPKVMQTLFGAPYTLGEAMLAVATQIDGNDEVDALFRDPPTTDEQLLDPWTLLPDRDDALRVPEVKLEAGEDTFESGSFGALMWYFMLAERVPLLEALDAVDGWGGDAYVGFERSGTTCVRARFRGDTRRDTTEMETALRHWVAAAPSSGATVQAAVGGDVVFESCDPGSAADSGADAYDRALQLVVSRTYVALSALQGGATDKAAQCVGDRVVHAFSLDAIMGTGGETPDQARVFAIFSDCMASD